MKRLFLAILSIYILLSFPQVTQAEVIEGNASSDVTVNNDVQGSGEVHTHIESTVNGQTKVLDSNKSGTYTLHNSSSDSTSTNTATVTSTTTPTPTHTATPTPTPRSKPVKKDPDPIASLESYFHTIIQRVLEMFRL